MNNKIVTYPLSLLSVADKLAVSKPEEKILYKLKAGEYKNVVHLLEILSNLLLSALRLT